MRNNQICQNVEIKSEQKTTDPLDGFNFFLDINQIEDKVNSENELVFKTDVNIESDKRSTKQRAEKGSSCFCDICNLG